MNVAILNLAKESCKKNIISKAILLHGSHAAGFANEFSDYDILVITDNRNNEKTDAFITDGGKRIQIDFMDINELKTALDNYENMLFKQILDLNIMAGRILAAQILEADTECRELIDTYRQYRNRDALIKRFIYTATNFFNDSKTDDPLLKNHSYQMAAINIGTAILIKNNIFWLHIKWQHRYLQKILLQEDYEDYLSIRWPQNVSEEKFLKTAKKLMKEYL